MQRIMIYIFLFLEFNMKAYARNPWLVETLEDFNFLCCPECAYKSKDDGAFMDHAIENHPKSKESSVFSGAEEESSKQIIAGSLKKGVKVISLPINLASIDIPQKDIGEENQLVDIDKSVEQCDISEDILVKGDNNLPGNRDPSEVSNTEFEVTKPKMTWIELISEALQNSPNHMLKLSDIYKSVSAKHPYYKIGDLSFKSSIRSTLTREKSMDMEKGFTKVKVNQVFCWTFSKNHQVVPKNISSIDILEEDSPKENSQVVIMEDPNDFFVKESIKDDCIDGKKTV